MKRKASQPLFLAAASLAVCSVHSSGLLAQTSTGTAGQRICSDYCPHCLGEGLRTTSGGVTFDLRRLRPEAHDRFVGSVLDGKRQMPPWRGVLAADQVESIWAFIRATLDR